MNWPLIRWVRRVPDEITSASDLLLAVRIVALALAIRVLKYVVPLPTLVRAVAPRPHLGPRTGQREQTIAVFARAAARLVRPRSEGSCLERSLILYRHLALAGAQPRLLVGFRRDHTAVHGHVWVVVDGEPVADSPAVCAGYDVALRFDSFGHPMPNAAA
jgi:hypothetical protein